MEINAVCKWQACASRGHVELLARKGGTLGRGAAQLRDIPTEDPQRSLDLGRFSCQSHQQHPGSPQRHCGVVHQEGLLSRVGVE
jgi:hypothetical protein